MGWMTGMVSGFLGEKQRMEMENRRQAENASANEAEVYKTLLNSPNPDIRAKAITGMLESARGPQKAGGIRGWLGQMEQSPLYGQMQSLIRSTSATHQAAVDEAGQAGQAGQPEPTGGALSQVPSGSLAQPATAATQGGPMAQPLPAPASREEAASTSTLVAAPPPQLQVPEVPVTSGIPGGVATPPPQAQARRKAITPPVLYSPEEAMLANKRAASQGDVEGEVAGLVAAGFSDVEARGLVKARYERAARGGMGGIQSIPGQMPDGSPAFGVFDRVPGSATYGKYVDPDTGNPLHGFIPRTTTGSTSMGADREALARSMFGKPFAQLQQAQQQQVMDAEISRAGSKAGAVTAGRGEAAADVPLTTQQRFAYTSDLAKEWTTATADRTKMRQAYSFMQTGLARYDTDPIGGSQAVLVTFQKILDPPSVVRESEYARSPQGLAARDWLQGMYDKYVKGGAGVPKPILAEMVKTAEAFLTDENLATGVANIRARLHKTAIDAEIDPFNVFGPDTPFKSGGGGTGGGGAQVGAPPPNPTGATGGGVGGWQVEIDDKGQLTGRMFKIINGKPVYQE